MKSGKIWGSTQPIYQDDHFEVNRIFAKKGGFCSLHKHECKANLFYVESGELEIEVHKRDYKLVDVTVIGPGESTIVNPGEAHRFRAKKNTVAFEIYFVKLLPNDIKREDHGGVK